jgi:hypothetical protein
MVVSYEILFTRAQNQLHGAETSSKNDNLGIKRFICPLKLADFMLKTNTPSRISERFFKQISFHAKYTFQNQNNIQNQFRHSKFIIGAKKRLCNFNTLKEKLKNILHFMCPLA